MNRSERITEILRRAREGAYSYTIAEGFLGALHIRGNFDEHGKFNGYDYVEQHWL